LINNKPHKLEIGMFLMAVVLLGFGLYFLGPSITGFVIKQVSYSDDVNLVVVSGGNYTLDLQNVGELKSLKIDGRVSSYGKARVYAVLNGSRHLVFDSTRIGENKETAISGNSNLITGLVAKEKDTYIIDSEKLGFDKLLSKGKVERKLKISVPYATEGAIEKVKAAGGEVVGLIAKEKAE